MRNVRGFTLIELLVVVAIIGLLSSVVLASLNTARAKARDANRVADLRSIQQALELYYNTHGQYPLICNGVNGSDGTGAWSSWGNCWTSGIGATYIPRVPTDPRNVDLGNCGSTANCHIYQYCLWNNRKSYGLAVNLENTPVPAKGNNSNCPVGGPNHYWVTN